MPAVVGARQHAAGHVGQQIFAHRPPVAEATAAVFRLVIGPVVDVGPAQRAGIKAVVLLSLGLQSAPSSWVCSLTLTSYPPAGKQPGLLFHRVEVAVQLVLLALTLAEPVIEPKVKLPPALAFCCTAS